MSILLDFQRKENNHFVYKPNKFPFVICKKF